ncbi:MAG: hypothetical protein H6822_07755 [Planctomycetaceae bacterium]|nr:hypothetical protein [Planctomycetales bacterium]MCB9922060.1 hypothetical protein [Planctomycetaceae bacterium]
MSKQQASWIGFLSFVRRRGFVDISASDVVRAYAMIVGKREFDQRWFDAFCERDDVRIALGLFLLERIEKGQIQT